MPKYLLNNNGQIISEVIKLLRRRDKIILFLDYDGTLTPIKKKPSLAVISPLTQGLLKQLNKLENVFLFIITGRYYKDINDIIGIKNISIISNHGLQINHNKKQWTHPEVKYFSIIIKKVSSLIDDVLPRFHNTFIEDKNLSFTVHYRDADNKSIPELKKTINEIVKLFFRKLKILKGKKIIEIRPNILCDKGLAVLKILNDLKIINQQSACIYIGDDRTDEDAFKVLNKKEITIHVGSSSNSKAKYYLRSTKEVYNFLEEIYLMQSERGGYV
jgi:trehalose-phosphatase